VAQRLVGGLPGRLRIPIAHRLLPRGLGVMLFGIRAHRGALVVFRGKVREGEGHY
jgi:hypothetical protein